MYTPASLNYHIISLGCSKNLTESERVNGIMDSTGMSQAESPEEADIIIINTCGFIEDAKKEAIDVIFETLNLKNEILQSPETEERAFSIKVAAVGCFTKRYLTEIKDEIPELDFIYGLIDENFITAMFKEFKIESGHSYNEMRKPLEKGIPYEYIKISDGCSNNCSYCAIPLIRGSIVSFPVSKIVEDVCDAARRKAVELNIIAQDIAAYNYDNLHLPELLNKISEVDGPEWIRLLYCHPDHITDEIIFAIRDNKKIVKYIDIPFQHINSNILRSMNRKGSFDKYLKLVEKLRSEIPDIVIRSTFMVGYPGETQRDFDELMKFLSVAKLDKVGCFIYSPEEGTPASSEPDMKTEIKVERYNELMELQREISLEKLNSFVDKTVRVMVEQKVDDENWIGRSEYDAPEVDGIFYLSGKDLEINTIVNARVVEAVDYDLIGVVTNE